jgi:DNA-binding LytR/AlgR family response regulator
MNSRIKILIVEDEMVIAANISMELTNLGYEVTAILPRGEDVLPNIKQNRPDLVLMDINLKGELDGIEIARTIRKEYDIPIIYLTANSDEQHFESAKETKPEAFISKPFKKLDLQRAIALTETRIREEPSTNSTKKEASPFIISDSVFVRHNDKEYLLVLSLKDMDENLGDREFLRVHRSFIVNVSQIQEVAHTHVVIAKKAIPLSRGYKGELMNRLHTL